MVIITNSDNIITRKESYMTLIEAQNIAESVSMGNKIKKEDVAKALVLMANFITDILFVVNEYERD